MEALMKEPHVYAAKADMCQFCMKSHDAEGAGYAKKPTVFFTNSREMSKTLNRKCVPGSHRHVPLMEGRARAAAIYPKGLCKAILQGTVRQARVDRGNLVSMPCVPPIRLHPAD